MGDSEGFKEIVNQVAIQAATAVMMAQTQTHDSGQPQPQTSKKHKGGGMVDQY